MHRTNSAQFGLVVITIVAATLLFQTPCVRGQITTGATSTKYNFSYTNPGSVLSFNLTATDASNGTGSGGQVTLNLTGDYNDSLPSSAGSALIEMYGFLPITVGDLPVQISSIKLNVNAKWVNGGGSSTTPDTYGSVFGLIGQQIGAAPAPASGDPSVSSAFASLIAHVTGNGYQIIPSTYYSGSPSTYVLGANTNYYLAIGSTTPSDNTTWTNTKPTVTITNEFGGNFGDGFGGYSFGFTWTTVPEPSTFALLGLGGFGLYLCRRSRIS